jgi:hypothetical protein
MDATGKMGKTGSVVRKEATDGRHLEYLAAAEGSVIEFDKVSDTIRICGVKYSMQVFRTLALAEPGSWLRVDERGEYLDISCVSEEMERAFDCIARMGRFKK